MKIEDLDRPLGEEARPEAFSPNKATRARIGFSPPPVDRLGIYSDKYRSMLRD